MPTTRSGTVSPARTLAIDLACLVAALLVSVPILLRFGDPQWSRWVYMFQAYVHPGEPPPPPRGYTGPWRGWHRNGGLAVQMGYRNGESHGQTVSWTDGGVRRLECYYVDGYRSGPWTERDETGKVTMRGSYRDGAPWHGCCYLCDRKAWTAVFRERRRVDKRQGATVCHGRPCRLTWRPALLYRQPHPVRRHPHEASPWPGPPPLTQPAA